METKDILRQLREKNRLTKDQLAERVMVTRQAVSRWENGETQPNTDTLKILSKEFDVSINTLLGSPRQLVCQCCGMPLQDEFIGRNKDGSLNEVLCRRHLHLQRHGRPHPGLRPQHGTAGLYRRPGAHIYEGNASEAGLLEEIRRTQ